MTTPPPADDDVDMVQVLKQRIAGGEYAIDAHAVAQAILTRRRESDPLQALCSQMLVALEPSPGPACEGEPLACDDPS